MKKILTVSLGALLVVGAANAEIASVDYVDDVAASKQDTITDLATIRSGAALGATAVQNLAGLGITATATELNYVDGVTSNIQTQLSNAQTTANGAQTTANAAQSTASTAQATANTASTNATAANDAIAGMDLATVGGTGQVVRSVTQTNGRVAATAEAVDDRPTADSTKLVTSDGVYKALDKKVNLKQGTNNAGKGLLVDGTTGELALADIATQAELEAVRSTAAAGQTAAEVNTAITNAINTLDVASVGEAGKFIITIKQENGKIAATTKSFVSTLSDGVVDAPTTDAVYDALQGKLSTTGTAAKATADASGNVITTTYATKSELTTGLNGKQNSSLGSTNADKAVITDTSGNITSGTIATGMITDLAVTSAKIANSAVTTAKIADGTITNADISASAAIAQSKISGLTTALDGKQDASPRDESGNSYFVADPDGRWKDMFGAMPKEEACERDGVKCALTHKSGRYAWEIVRE